MAGKNSNYNHKSGGTGFLVTAGIIFLALKGLPGLLSELKKFCPDIRERVLHALRNEPYDLWQKDCSPDLPDPDEDP